MRLRVVMSLHPILSKGLRRNSRGIVFSKEINDAKRLRRWLKIHRQMFKAQIFKVADIALKHKAQIVRNKIAHVKSLSATDV